MAVKAGSNGNDIQAKPKPRNAMSLKTYWVVVLILLTILHIEKAMSQLSHLEQHNEQLKQKETRYLLGKVDVTTLLRSND